MDSKLRAGVVGLGHLGRHHARIFSEMPGVELVAVCDVRPEVEQEATAAFPGMRFRRSSTELLGHLDLVSIVTPTSTHRDVARPFLETGVATLIEKPIAANPAEARELVELAERQGGVLQVGHIEEFNPAVEACRGLVRRPRFVEAHRMGAFSGRGVDVDVVLDLMIHDLDLILNWVDSEIRWIHAIGIPVLSSQMDMASVRLEFQNGTVANLTASRVSFNPQRRMRLFMPERYLRLDFLARTVECVERKLEPDGSASIAALPVVVQDHEPLRMELQSFVEAVRGKKEPRVSGRRALRALEAAHAIKIRMLERGA